MLATVPLAPSSAVEVAPSVPVISPQEQLFTIPTDFASQISQATDVGEQAAQQFVREHPTTEEWMFPAYAVSTGGYAPRADVEQGELAELHTLQDARTPALTETATDLANRGLGDMWQSYLREYTATATPAQALVATTELNDALTLTNDVAQNVKGASMRQRPFIVDPTIKPAVGAPGNNPSYPSGHAAASFAAYEVLRALMPERDAELRSTASQVAFSRLYAGMHFRSDVMAGARVGAMVGSYIAHLNATPPPVPAGVPA